MQEYELADSKGHKKRSLPSSDLHTWRDVLAEVDDASKQYNEPDGVWGKVRKAFRKSGDRAVSISAWLVLLPASSEYFSILCGGLTLIIGVSIAVYMQWIWRLTNRAGCITIERPTRRRHQDPRRDTNNTFLCEPRAECRKDIERTSSKWR